MLLTARIFSDAAGIAPWDGAATFIGGLAGSSHSSGKTAARAPSAGRGRLLLATLRRLVARLGAFRPAGVLLHVVLGGRLDQRANAVLHGRDPVGNLDPLRPVPLLHVSRMVAVVVGTRHAIDRRRKASEPKLLPARIADAQGLEPAPHVLAGDHLFAGHLLGVADRFGNDDRVHHAAVVKVLADLILGGLTLTLVHHVLDDVLDRRVVAADTVEVEGEIALGPVACRPRVILVARPPDA